MKNRKNKKNLLFLFNDLYKKTFSQNFHLQIQIILKINNLLNNLIKFFFSLNLKIQKKFSKEIYEITMVIYFHRLNETIFSQIK